MKAKNDSHQGKLYILKTMPAIIIVAIQWILRYGTTRVFDNDLVVSVGVIAGILGGLALLIWWIFFSGASKSEKWIATLLILLVSYISYTLADKSIQTAFQGFMYLIYAVPLMSLSFVLWAVASKNLLPKQRRVTMVYTILLTAAVWIFIRSDGMDGSARHRFAWRWAKTSEERLLSKLNERAGNKTANMAEMSTIAEWPGFRGPERDGIIRNLKISSDWKNDPPRELWRRKIGPGCSSFAISGDYAFTQEQLGDFEMISCYRVSTGDLIWQHSDSARFWDSHAGAGPRSTPTFSNGRIYAMGATGILNALKAENGEVIWTRNAASDSNTKILEWGFTGSPLVIDSLVIVAVSGDMIAYDVSNGEPLWYSKDNGSSYSSPQLLTIKGIPQILFMSSARTISVDPATGERLWVHSWDSPDRILQPALLSDGDLLLTPGMYDIRRITVDFDQDNWMVREKWTSSDMKVNFNDMVAHEGFIYGFDGPSIACVNATDGTKSWKGRPYRGWLVLFEQQDLLLVLTELGDLALVEANPEKFVELAKIPAITGKTWSHPAIAGDILLVRNSEEMAAFKLHLMKN